MGKITMTKEAELSDIPTYCAHVRRDPENPSEIEYQSVAEHEEGVAKLCAAFAADFGAEEDGEIAGLTHDAGPVESQKGPGGGDDLLWQVSKVTE